MGIAGGAGVRLPISW